MGFALSPRTAKVGHPIFFAVLIIIIGVFLPLFTLLGVEEEMFSPMAGMAFGNKQRTDLE